MTPIGTWAYAAGASGTVTIPSGASVRQIVAHGAGGSVSVFGGPAIPTAAAPMSLPFSHDLVQAVRKHDDSGDRDIVFTGTTGYFVEYTKAGNT